MTLPSYAGYNTAFYLNSSTYTGVKGGNITGTVTREPISTGCTASCDWFPASPAYVTLQIPYPGTGTNPIEGYDVSSNGLYYITIPANQTTASFSIPVPQNSSVDYDRTGNLNVASGYVDSTHIQSASLTIQDNNNPVGVGFVSGGTLYVGTNYNIQGGTGGSDQTTIRFFRDYLTDARTINYSLSGSSAVAGTDYTPSIGTVTIPNESDHVDVTVTANNTNQSTDKTINVRITSGTYAFWAPYTNMEVYIYNDFPTVDVGASSPQMIRGDTTSSLVFQRESYWPQSGTPRTIHYNLAGSTAVYGTDYTPSLSGTVVIPAGGYAVTNTMTTAIESTTNGIKYLDVGITASSGYNVGASSSTSIEIDEDFPNVDILASPTMTRGESTATLIFQRESYYPGISAAKTVNYTLAGSTAVNGVDYTPSLSGSAVIPAGGFALTNTLTPGTESSLNGTKIINMALQPGTMYFYGVGSNATTGILEDAPMIGVTATAPNAIQIGASGTFTITRTYGYPKSVTANFSLSGTAIAGTNYTNLPLSVTFAPYQISTNLVIGPTTSPVLTNSKTVVLTISTNSLYYSAVNTQAVVTILPPGSATNSVTSPVGRYWRGTGSDPTDWSIVVPLDYEKGTSYSNTFGNCSTLYPGLSAWSANTYFHYNETNTLSQTNWANRIPFNNPIVAFGERVGGTPLYLNQEYNFGIYAGDPVGVGTPVEILAFYRTNFAFAGETDVYPPNFSNSNSWNNFTSNGLQVTAAGFGLTTTLSTTPKLSFGATTLGAYTLTHTANSSATNYYYLILQYGLPNDSFPIGMAQATNGAVAPSYLYSLEFEQRPLWRAVAIDQPHFNGSPLPPFYAGMTLDEILTNTPSVSNSVGLSPSACTNIDQSPELRRSPILDQFVADMGNDPMALANYVLNDINLTDPMDYNDDGSISEQSINPSGVTRGALGVFLEKQGSPVEQCALLVYLLRQAGVPATYMFPPHNGLQILDTRLSQMLKFQVHGSFSDAGQLYSSNTMIAVNYPWVAAYIGTNWVHIFPWLKDYDMVEGLNLYEYMPTNYSRAYGWAKDYIYGASNLLSLAANGDNTPRVIFPRYLTQTLNQNYPGVSINDIGMQTLLRRHNCSRWQDFPTPTWLTNTSYTVESLSASSITNVDSLMTNIFDSLSIEIYSQTDPHKDIQTGLMRLTDLHNRQFYITATNNATNQILLSLVLSPFRTNVTTQYAFTNDSTLLSKEVLSTTLDQFDDQLWVRFTYNRHRALGSSYAINPYSSYLGFAANRHIVIERPLRKGELAAICLDYGRVTQDMLNVHAQDLWQMENTLRTNSSANISPDVYQGATIYLAGMLYYKKLSDFDQINQNLHKVDVLSSWAAGLSKLSPRRNSSGNLASGAVDPILPNVDMFDYDVATVGNASSRPDSGDSIETATQNYNLILVVNGSAEEHQVLNDYYQQSNAVSTVRLLQLAQSRGLGIVPLNINTYSSQGTTVYQGSQLQNFDPYVWNQIVSAFQNNNDDYGFVTGYITPGPITNASYSGIGAFIFGFNQQAALISPNSLNGAFGENLPSGSVAPANDVNYNLTMGDTATLTFQPPSASTTLLPDQVANFNSSQVYNQILSGDYTATPYDSSWSANVVSSLNLSYQSTQNQTLAQDVQETQQTGFWGTLSDMGSQLLSKVGDPVNNITGEFYVNDADLRLAGPIPLSLGRNYSSLNLADNQFGPGWKFSIAPYLSVAQGGANIYAADMDGAVLNYVQTPTNNSLWMPTTAGNPQLVNNTTAGVGGLVNRLRDRLVQTVNGSITNFTLYGADGSVRAFQYITFNNGSLSQTRPYLLAWTNNCGNSCIFTYGTDPTQPDFGQVRRIQCSNGNYLGFYYDVYGHIIQAYCGDGRRLTYEYDEFGDLITVTLPDGTTRSYQYVHSTQSVTNGATVTQQPYSTHLIVEEDNPDGRVLQNAYDSQRRVTNQLSTAGTDLTPVRTATFNYSNNFNVTNSPTNSISGYTIVVDGNNGTNRYDYTNSLITQVTDPLGQTIQQIWYADNASVPGYPRSVSQRKDKRGTWSQFKYDANGNITNTVITGDLTGNGILTQTATNTAVYNTNNLPLQRTDPVGNSTVYVYDPIFLFLPQQMIRYAGSTPVFTNFQFFGSATNIVTLGSTTQTNFARGLMTRAIRAYNSPDAATNDFNYNGQGFITQSMAYTGTSDPVVTNTFFYNERGELVDQTDALGATTEFAYDDIGRQTEQENFDENANLLSWNFNYYNDNGELTWVDGPLYNPEDYVWRDYDGAGRLTTEIRWRCEGKQDGTGVEAPAGYNLYAQTYNSYDVMGNLTRTVDPRGAITTNTWDSLCRLVRRQSFDVDGVTLLSSETFGYEPGGLVRFHTNALGGFTETDYTAAGQPEYRHNADGSTNAWRYYFDGRIYREFQGNGAYVQTTYDDVNRITTKIFYSANGTPLQTNSAQLDRRGNTIKNTDPNGNIFSTTFDGLDRVKLGAGPAIVTVNSILSGINPGPTTYETNVSQQTLNYFYDGSGRVLTFTNTLGEKTVTTKDAIGRILTVQIYAPGSITPLRFTTNGYSADHHSVTVTEGTGAGAVSTTTYVDNDGRSLIVSRSPGIGRLDYDLHTFDLAGNEIEHDRASTGSVLWSFTSWTFDGLNRTTTETSRDYATTTFQYDQMGNLTNRAMPGSLTWSATYSTAGQMLTELDRSGTQGARTNAYAYYSGSWPGLLQTVTDERGVTKTNFYDDFLRLTNTTTSGPQAEQQMSVVWQYDPRGLVSGISQSYANTNTGPSTKIQRTYDPYSQLASDTLTIGGGTSAITQQWDSAGRRTQVSTGMGFQYRADNLITAMNDASYGYGDNGLLTGRTNSFRSLTVNSRDPLGRPSQTTTKVNGTTQLTETWNWLDDGSPSNYVAARGDFTDTRNFSYATLTRKLTQETFNVSGSLSRTNNYTFDNGSAGGLGILTKAIELSSISNEWVGGVDALSRIIAGTNTVIQRAASGHVNGAATLRGLLNGQPLDLRYDSRGASAWSATLGLQTGTNTLTVYADHPGGVFTTNRASTFTVNSGSQDRVTSQYDGIGNVTNLTWKNGSGQTIKTQTLTWDAFNRLVKVNERDTNNNGFNLQVVFDVLGRQVQTTETTVSNNFALTNGPEPLTIGYQYDPQVEFEAVAVSLSQGSDYRQDALAYGPDMSGRYGGMQGVGGLEEINSGTPAVNVTAGIISDGFGNVLAGITNGVVTWNSARSSLYGPADGFGPPRLSLASPAFASLAWRSRSINTAGLVQLGLRPYDFTRRGFLCADPLGHGSDEALNTAFGGNPAVYFDADGRIAKGIYNEGALDASALSSGVFWGGVADTSYNLGGRTVNGIAQAGEIGSDMMGQTAASLFGYGGDYQGYSTLYQSIYNNPSTGPSSSDVLLGTLQAEANLGTLGLYGMGKGFGQAAATGDFTSAQDASLNSLLLSGAVRGMQAAGIDPLDYGYMATPTGNAILSLLTGGSDAAAATSATSAALSESSAFASTAEQQLLLSAPRQPLALLPEHAESLASGTGGGNAAGGSTGGQLPAPSPWPPNGGFIQGTVQQGTLMPGDLIDRYGYGGGKYVSPSGTPMAARALRPGTEQLPFNTYKVIKPIPVKAGGATPWFGQPGLGTQYELPVSVKVLVNRGIIAPVN